MITRILFSLCLTLACSCAAAQQPRTISFYEDYLLERKISGEAVVAPPKGSEYFDDIDVAVTIDTAGNVSAAEFSKDNFSGIHKHAKHAIDAVKLWKFNPILYRGTPVVAQGTISITYQSANAPAAKSEFDFKDFDYDTFKVTLQRTACFGSCPDYQVSILGSGQVEFDPDPRQVNEDAGVHRAFSRDIGILVPLKNVDNIDRSDVERLITAINKANFFELKDSYEAGITDSPTYVVSVTMNGVTKTVTDYVGQMAGMPLAVSELEDLIDEISGTSRWIKGTTGFYEGLKSTNFDLKSKDAAMLAVLLASSERSSEADIIRMIEAGLPLDADVTMGRMAVSEQSSKHGSAVGSALLSASISSGKANLAAYLIERGWLQKTPQNMLNGAIAASGRQCNLAATELVVKAGLSPNARDDEGKTGLLQLVSGYPTCSDDLPKFLQTLQKWIDLGADVNAADSDGNTSIFGLEKLDALEILLANGVNPKHKDKEGNSAAFSSWQDAIVLRLLEAGADPRGRGYDGKSLKKQAKERGDMPGTTAWLREQKTRN